MKKIQTTNRAIILDQQPFEYTIKQSRRRRRSITLMINPNAELVVHAPIRTSIYTIERLIKERALWIRDKLLQLNKTKIDMPQHKFIAGEIFYYLGDQYPLRLIEPAGIKPICRLNNNYLELVMPIIEDSTIHSKKSLKLLMNWYYAEADKIVAERALYWSNHLGVRFRKLKLSSAKKRWGSCSTHNDININWRLIMTPLAILDYVVMHELCHIIHKNHSKKFWQLVNSFLPDYKDRQNQLKKMQSLLMVL